MDNASLAEYMDLRMIEFEKRANERFITTHDNISIATAQLDKRLENMNKFREVLSDQASRMTTRVEVDAKFEAISEKLEVANKTNWPVWGAFGSVIVAIAGGLWMIIGLQIQATNQPVIVGMEAQKVNGVARDRSIADNQLGFNQFVLAENSENAQRNRDISMLLQGNTASTVDREQLNNRMRLTETASQLSGQADAASRNDREQLNARLRLLESTNSTNLAESKSNVSEEKQKLVEIETQFRAMSNHINSVQDGWEQWIKIIFEKVFPGQRYSGTGFRPQMYKN